jgi:hypothetical protein
MQRGLSTWGYLALTPTLAAFQAISPPPNPISGIELRSIEVADLNTDRVRFQLHLGGIAQNDISIRALSFDNATVNGVPVYFPPTSRTFKLTKGRELRDIGSLQATLYFRDLDTLEPLRNMVRDRKAEVQATIRLQPELTLLQRMVLRTSAVWASMNFQRSVEVEVPGGTIGRGAALMALATADLFWVLGRSGLDWRKQRDDLVQEVRTSYAPRVFVIETSYQLRRKSGEKTLMSWRGLGFHDSSGELLVPAEAVEPWLFDGVVADAIASGAAEVVNNSRDILARTASGVSYSFKKGSLKIVRVAQDREKAISMDRRKVYEVRARNSTANVARLLIASPHLPPVPEASAGIPLQTLALFRLHDSVPSERTPEILILPATPDKDHLRLVDPVDLRASGSPVITQEGIVGMLLDQSTIAPMKAIRKKLRDVE